MNITFGLEKAKLVLEDQLYFIWENENAVGSELALSYFKFFFFKEKRKEKSVYNFYIIKERAS